MAADVDIERVGFPVHDGHCNAQFVGKLDFCLLSRYMEEVWFALISSKNDRMIKLCAAFNTSPHMGTVVD
jgi:hypothetical protein